MGMLIGGFLFLFGLIFFLVGGGIALVSDLLSGNLKVGLANLNMVVFGGLGLVFMIVGAFLFIRSRIKGKQNKALAEKIFAMGVPAEATITFIDKNYGMLVNNKPIYSIVEFKFRDSSGSERVGRKNNVSSDLAIRLKFEVGAKVQIKYMNENPDQNILIMKDPTAPD
ncbi:MAG TPA: DUF3592 domain-containing protein [Patescibacteria group bacterium]|nr:DUF3592 domain-containing protein [Patescibacteria group bacterium]